LRQAQLIVERQVTHMALLLDDLLDIARITQGKLQLKKETLSLIPWSMPPLKRCVRRWMARISNSR
jgi:signal transduction histidine kinase